MCLVTKVDNRKDKEFGFTITIKHTAFLKNCEVSKSVKISMKIRVTTSKRS